MTVTEIKIEFEKQFAPLIKKGVRFSCVFAKEKTQQDLEEVGIGRLNVKENREIHPSVHDLYIDRPFFFNLKLLPENFMEFKIEYLVDEEEKPEEFKVDEDILPYYTNWTEERILANAAEHAVEICEQVGVFSLTHMDICDILAGGDFVAHIKFMEEEKARWLTEEYNPEWPGPEDEEDEF